MTWKGRKFLGLVAFVSLLTLLNVSFSLWRCWRTPDVYYLGSDSQQSLVARRRLRIDLSIVSDGKTYADSSPVNCSGKPTDGVSLCSVVRPTLVSSEVLTVERAHVEEVKPTVRRVEEKETGNPLRRLGHRNTTTKLQPNLMKVTRRVDDPKKRATTLNRPRKMSAENSTILLQGKALKPQKGAELTKGSRNSTDWNTKGILKPRTVGLTRGATKTVDDCGKGNNSGSTGGYLISLDYDQQLMGSFKGFYNLAVFASLFNLSIVEPYIYGKGRMGVPRVMPNGKTPQFSKLTDFYDHHKLKCAIRSCAKTNFVPYEEFAVTTSSNIIFLSFLPSLNGYDQYFSGDEKIVEIDNITDNLNNSLGILNEWTWFTRYQERETFTFTWSRAILIDARPLHSIALLEIKARLDSVIRRHIEKYGAAVTVVLDNWRDIDDSSYSRFFYYVQGFNSIPCPQMFTAPHSTTVVTAAENFSKTLNLTRPVVGIHIRGEKLILGNDPSYYTGCMQQLRELLDSGALPTVANSSVALFHDLGKYGSNSCHHYNDCLSERLNFQTEINDFGYRVASYDPSGFRPALLQSVFAAFVENDFLSNVDILVTVGLGNYQGNIVDRFLNHTGGVRDNLHRLCSVSHPVPQKQ